MNNDFYWLILVCVMIFTPVLFLLGVSIYEFIREQRRGK